MASDVSFVEYVVDQIDGSLDIRYKNEVWRLRHLGQ